MKITKKQLAKIIQEELTSVMINEENPTELVKQWVIEIKDFIASQYAGGKGKPISDLPQEEFPSIIEALESVRRTLKDVSARSMREGFFDSGTRTGIKAAMKNLKDSLTILEREGYDEAYDHVISAIEALEYPE